MRRQTVISRARQVSDPNFPGGKKWVGRDTVKVVQLIKAHRGGVSAMGQRYNRGDVILHLSSARNTGEIFTLLKNELWHIIAANPGRYKPYTPRKKRTTKK